MPALGEILRRFRSHGVPGAAASVAVPSDTSSGVEVELAPVFAALEKAQGSNEELLIHAEREADRRRAAAREQARQVILEARTAATGARSEALASSLAKTDEDCRQILEDGRSESQRVVRIAEERIPELVEQLVSWALDQPNRATTTREPQR